MPTEIAGGTSGFSYDAWKGSFYPHDLPARRRLEYYASRLPSVEINNTFYRMPKASVLEGWASQVPESFRFAIKASRRITHFKRLKDVGEETGYLLDVTRVLGARLGALLFQLPPNLVADRPRLEAFLELLPEGCPAAFEFRHPSWGEPGIGGLLASRGVARVTVDAGETAPESLETGPGLAYLRLRAEDYPADALRRWAQALVTAQPERALVFFKHEDAGAGPRLAARFLELAAGELARRKPARPRPGKAKAATRRKGGDAA